MWNNVENLIFQYFSFLWEMTLLLAPMLLLGLLLSGCIHVFISRDAILKWFQKDNLKSVVTSAAIGVPLPLCSCSVVPVVAEMRRKGASRSACMSFLITAPETGADSILITQVFFGWIVAIVRPIISFVTAVVAGLCCFRGNSESRQSSNSPMVPGQTATDPQLTFDPITCQEDDHCREHGVYEHQSLMATRDDCYVGLDTLKELWSNWRGTRERPDARTAQVSGEAKGPISVEEDPLTLRKIVKHIFQYGFIDIADDILFALIFGIALGALIYLVVPSDLAQYEYARWISYPVVLAVAVPLYTCASASTPIAAALVAKGFSPGAALIFLMTGPATNTSTIAIILGQFGSRFATIYVSVVIAVTLILAIAIDTVLIAIGIGITVTLESSHDAVIQWLQITAAVAFIALIVWRAKDGALKSGWRDFVVNFRFS